jgi:hypothetical protein
VSEAWSRPMSGESLRPGLPWLVLLTPLLPLLAAVPGGRFALPLLAPLTLYPAFVERVRRREYGAAWALGMAWAVLLSAGVILFTALWPETARDGFLNGEPYRQEMFHWIATGEGKEGDWRGFLPHHVGHLAVFVLLTWASGGYLGLALGAFLVAYMSYFVGSYAVAVDDTLLGAVVAWVPWSVIRVMAFVLLGSLFARPLLARKVWPFERPELRLMALAGAGIFADILLKAATAPAYGLFLRRLGEGAAAFLP